MPGIKIDDNFLFEVERRLNVYLNSNKLEQLENQQTEKLQTRAIDNGPRTFESRSNDEDDTRGDTHSPSMQTGEN
ncbi:hypothetical protein TNCV_2266011 [Trichonephila clavipes]|nr:hypothetical protein TNCV_2266011 [Trichonephila clavipes]